MDEKIITSHKEQFNKNVKKLIKFLKKNDRKDMVDEVVKVFGVIHDNIDATYDFKVDTDTSEIIIKIQVPKPLFPNLWKKTS